MGFLTMDSPFREYLDSDFRKGFGDFFLPLRAKEEELRELTIGEALARNGIEERLREDTLEGIEDAFGRDLSTFGHVLPHNRASRYLSYEIQGEKGKVIILPGGGYEYVAGFVEGYPIAKEFNKLGYSAYVLNYSVGEEARFPRPLFDVAGSVTDIIPPGSRRYALLGFSAGGHLASYFCTKEAQAMTAMVARPGALLLGYPVITMRNATHGGSRLRVLGEDMSDARMDMLSVERHIDHGYPPTYCWCGEKDDCVPSKNSHDLEEALRKNNVEHEFYYGDFAKHGLGDGHDSPMEGWIEHAAVLLDRWLDDYFF